MQALGHCQRAAGADAAGSQAGGGSGAGIAQAGGGCHPALKKSFPPIGGAENYISIFRKAIYTRHMEVRGSGQQKRPDYSGRFAV